MEALNTLGFNLPYDYAGCVKSSEKVSWRLDDVLPETQELDFTQRFLPESLVLVEPLSFLNREEKKKLNQIMGNAYLNIFSFVEEYIIGAIEEHMDSTRRESRDPETMRALSRFIDEEIKHQQLFSRYRQAFNRGFGYDCGVLESAREVAELILQKGPIAVMLLTLHIELMTQDHFTDSVRDNSEVDPLFASLLKHHWMEEAQHSKIDALELEKSVLAATPAEIDQAFDEYLEMVEAFDGLLKEQSQLDLNSLSAVIGRQFTSEQAEQLLTSRQHAYRKTFLNYGMEDKEFLRIAGIMSPEGRARIEAKAKFLAQPVVPETMLHARKLAGSESAKQPLTL